MGWKPIRIARALPLPGAQCLILIFPKSHALSDNVNLAPEEPSELGRRPIFDGGGIREEERREIRCSGRTPSPARSITKTESVQTLLLREPRPSPPAACRLCLRLPDGRTTVLCGA